VTEIRVRRRWKLLDYLKERREYCYMRKEALDRVWRVRFGGSFLFAARPFKTEST
jgi:hypothetical protein